MTLILSDGRRVLADGLMSTDLVAERCPTPKLKKLADGTVLGFCGVLGYKEALFKWYEDGADPAALPPGLRDDGWTLIAFTPDIAFYFGRDVPYPVPALYPCAFGSAADYCMIALHAGIPIDRIMDLAEKHMPHIGGLRREETIGESPAPNRKSRNGTR